MLTRWSGALVLAVVAFAVPGATQVPPGSAPPPATSQPGPPPGPRRMATPVTQRFEPELLGWHAARI